MSVQKPVICLLPGLGGSGRLFGWLVDALQGEFETRVAVYGDGDNLADFVASARSQLPQQRPICLVAESFSGPIALKLLAENEFHFHSAVLCNTFAKPPWSKLLPLAGLLPASFMGGGRLRGIAVRLIAGKSTSSDASGEPTWETVLQLINETDRHSVHQQLRALRDFDVDHLLPTIEQPVLYLQADADRLIHQTHGRHIASRLPDCTVSVVAGPHLLLQMAAIECATLIKQHIADIA